MQPARRSSYGLRVYIAAVLTAGGFAALRGGSSLDSSSDRWLVLAVLVVLLAAVEYISVRFQDQDAKVGLSPAECLLLPMLVALPPGHAVAGVTAGMAIAWMLRWRSGPVKVSFNVAQYACAAWAASALWETLHDAEAVFSLRNAAVGTLALVVFASLTHLFVLIAVKLSMRRPLRELIEALEWATLVNLAGSITLGLLFAAALLDATWTVVLFPVPLLGFYLGYKAILTQRRESRRVVNLHAATRALAGGGDLGRSIVAFLEAGRDVVGSREAHLVLKTQRGTVWYGVDPQGVVSEGRLASDPRLERVLRALEDGTESLVATTDGVVGSDGSGRVGPADSNLVAVPLLDDRFVLGCVVAIDKVGAAEFSNEDVRLLESLANELIVRLDAHRLFTRVSDERERFESIFLGTKDGICLIDSVGIVRAWNPALEKISGYAEDEMIGRVWSDRIVVRGAAHRRIADAELAALDPGTQLELVTRSGPTRYIAVSSQEISSGQDASWVVLVRDVTLEHAAEEAKSDFLATISHELRTPLTTIRGAVQILDRGVDNLPPGTADQMISVTRRGAERLERLLVDLLTVSEYEAAPGRPELHDVGVADVVRATVGRFAAATGLIEIVEPAGKITVKAEGGRLGQALWQVVDNAVKFGGPGGTISVRVRQDNGLGLVEVIDDGPGVSEADQERIFERFVRLGPTLTRETQGAGVGLYIAKRAVEGAGGSISVANEDGRGARFTLSFPLARPALVELQRGA